MAGRVTPRQAAIVIAAFVLGGVAAFTAARLTRDLGTNPGTETLARIEATVAGSAVDARVVRLPEGFAQRFTPSETTLNLVVKGTVEVEIEGSATEYIAGTSFLVQQGVPYVVRVLDAAELSVVELAAAGT